MRRLVVIIAFIGAIAAVVALNGRAGGSALSASAAIHLREVAQASGIDFVHQAPTLDPKVEHISAHIAALGACVSVADVNNDNWPDLYFTSSRLGTANALYLNQQDGTFRDVSADVGVASLNRAGEGVSMGAVWADYDNDGFEDLLVYKWGYPQLLRNLGNGRFADVTAPSGLRVWMNSNGAVWFDFDRDGLLGLSTSPATSAPTSISGIWSPQLARKPDNIKFVRQGAEHLGEHGGNYLNPTTGPLLKRQ